MCLDNIEEIAAAVEAAKHAKAMLETFEAGCVCIDATGEAFPVSVELREEEARLIYTRRLERAEQALRDLGFRGPVVKPAPADAGDAQRTLASNRTGENR